MTNEEEAAEIERELTKLSDRASRLSTRTSRSTRHRWNRVWSNINSAIVGCREIIGASATTPAENDTNSALVVRTGAPG